MTAGSGLVGEKVSLKFSAQAPQADPVALLPRSPHTSRCLQLSFPSRLHYRANSPLHILAFIEIPSVEALWSIPTLGKTHSKHMAWHECVEDVTESDQVNVCLPGFLHHTTLQLCLLLIPLAMHQARERGSLFLQEIEYLDEIGKISAGRLLLFHSPLKKSFFLRSK